MNKRQKLLGQFRLTLLKLDGLEKEQKEAKRKVKLARAEINSYQNAIRNGDIE